MSLEMTDEKLNEIFKGAKVTWIGDGSRGNTFPAGEEGHIHMYQAVEWHLTSKSWAGTFQIIKIELTEENKKRFYEWLAQND